MEALAADGLPTKIAHLAVKGLPTSGKPDELMNAAGISPRHIVAAATRLLAAK
jgi:transketolase